MNDIKKKDDLKPVIEKAGNIVGRVLKTIPIILIGTAVVDTINKKELKTSNIIMGVSGILLAWMF